MPESCAPFAMLPTVICALGCPLAACQSGGCGSPRPVRESVFRRGPTNGRALDGFGRSGALLVADVGQWRHGKGLVRRKGIRVLPNYSKLFHAWWVMACRRESEERWNLEAVFFLDDGRIVHPLSVPRQLLHAWSVEVIRQAPVHTGPWRVEAWIPSRGDPGS